MTTDASGFIKVLYLNNDGGGFAKYVEVATGMSLSSFLLLHLGTSFSPGEFTIRVNRQPSDQDYILKQDDRISVTPVKVEGNTC